MFTSVAGNLSPNMIGQARISLTYEEAQIEGLLTDMTVHTKPIQFNSKQANLRTKYEVSLSIQVGLIQIKEISLSHEIQVIS